MKPELKNLLNQLSESEFHQLDIAIQLAKQARSIKRDFNLSDKEFCRELEIEKDDLRSYLNGGFEYTIKDMGNAQAVYYKLQSQKNQRETEEKTKDMTRVNLDS